MSLTMYAFAVSAEDYAKFDWSDCTMTDEKDKCTKVFHVWLGHRSLHRWFAERFSLLADLQDVVFPEKTIVPIDAYMLDMLERLVLTKSLPLTKGYTFEVEIGARNTHDSWDLEFIANARNKLAMGEKIFYGASE
jgi:hypothetical protein